MPSDKEIEIILRLRDEVTKVLQGVQSNLHKFSNLVKEISRDMRLVGRELSYVGMSMTAVGAAIVTPLTAAYKTAGKFNAEIAQQLRQTRNVFDNLSLEIGKSLLPVMRQLTNSVANMVGWWKSLDQSMKDRIIQNVWNLGKNLIFLGTAFVIVGKAISTLANLGLLLANFDKLLPIIAALVSPLGLVVVGVVALTAAMIKFKDVSDGILDGIASAHNTIFPWLPAMDSSKAKAGFDSVREQLSELDNLRKQIMNSLSGQGASAEDSPGGFWSGFELAITEAGDNLKDFQKIGVSVATNMTSAMSGMFTSFFDDAFNGNLKKGKDYFISFAKSIAKIFTDLISQMITQWIMVNVVMRGQDAIGTWLGIGSKALSLGSGVTGTGISQGSFGSDNFVSIPTNTVASPYLHSGGIVRAHSGLKIDEVPIIAQTGERVLSRAQNREYERGSGQAQPTVVVIQAWDTQDIMRNRKSIEGIIMNALKNNSSLRGVVKTYG